MDENLIPHFDDDKVAKVRGSLFNRLIQAILANRWSTGWGIIAEKGASGGIFSVDPSIIPSVKITYWRGKVTASSSTSADHTIKEVDADDNVIEASNGGRVTETGKAYNERKGVPVDTFVNVFEHPPATSGEYADYKFLIPDGLTDSPKQLLDVDLTADTTDWDIEVDSSAVQYDTGRVYFDASAVSLGHFWREFIVDASGMLTNVSGESRWLLKADTDSGSYDGALTLVADGVDGTKIKHNQAQAAVVDTLTFAGTSNEITVSCPEGTDADFDAGGHYNDLTKTITIGLANDPGETGGGLPSGTSGQILVHDGNNWVAQNTVTETVFTAATIDGSDDLVFTRKTVTIIATAAAANATVAGEECP